MAQWLPREGRVNADSGGRIPAHPASAAKQFSQARANPDFGLSVVDSSSAVIGNSDIRMLGNGQLSVLSFSTSSTRLNADPVTTTVVADNISFSDHHSTFYSNGSYPNGLIFCGADGGGEVAPGCP